MRRKKLIFAGMFAVAAAAGLAGCSHNNTKQETEKTTEKTTEKKQTKGKKASEASTEAEKPDVKECIIYAPDDNVETLINGKVKIRDVTAQKLLKEMIKMGTLEEGTKINSFQIRKQIAYIDFNKAFEKTLRKMGSSGEGLTVQAVTKTICDNLGTKAMKFTVEGKVLETGHNIYDEPLRPGEE
ncbi:GerMN domain-containing protein [Anaerostipes sp.]|uniref:GerMN domain-containing protein n=1 Tax=Anaerostipes sp. TaxID=1872530 RepID=UPI0025BAF505|nr:GerMN domain-containing protein [Anaerostipes sp.]MBS7007075.1 GerMN domain-containing protein [Anaerostipes sp.]